MPQRTLALVVLTAVLSNVLTNMARSCADRSLLPANALRIDTEKQALSKRLLVGIFSMDDPYELECRNQFRELFVIKSGVVCSLARFREQQATGGLHASECPVVYTFVIGGEGLQETPRLSTMLVDSSRPILQESHALVQEHPDMTVLNIRENMEDGKSQTWFYYAHSFGFDYVAKSDTDTIWNIPLMQRFLAEVLPPAPYNRGILAGRPMDKLWWGKWRKSPTDYDEKERQAKEGYLQERYGDPGRLNLVFHLYPFGEFYLLSNDLVETVIEQSRTNATYLEYAEDHDVATMAFHSTRPVQFIFLSSQDMMFWDHGTKIKKERRKWERKWKRAKEELRRSMSES